jgi:hypothetical protein
METMRFTIEQCHLTDAAGKPTPAAQAVAFFSQDASSADEAVHLFVRDRGAEIIGTILQFPGFQAVATMRSDDGVYTLQVGPTSQQLPVLR